MALKEYKSGEAFPAVLAKCDFVVGRLWTEETTSAQLSKRPAY